MASALLGYVITRVTGGASGLGSGTFAAGVFFASLAMAALANLYGKIYGRPARWCVYRGSCSSSLGASGSCPALGDGAGLRARVRYARRRVECALGVDCRVAVRRVAHPPETLPLRPFRAYLSRMTLRHLTMGLVLLVSVAACGGDSVFVPDITKTQFATSLGGRSHGLDQDGHGALLP